MSDLGINLLPEDLRKQEEREQKQPVPTKKAAGFSAPASQFEERLHALSSEKPGFFERVKQWFMTVPSVKVEPTESKLQMSPKPITPKNKFEPTKRVEPTKPPIKPVIPPVAQTRVTAPAITSPSPAMNRPEPVAPVMPKPPAKPTPPSPVPLGVLLNVNLLPSELRPQQGGDKPVLKLAAVAVGALLIIGIGYAVLSSLVTGREAHIEDLKQQAEQLKGDINKYQKDFNDLEAAGRRMENVLSLLVKRSSWLKFFNTMEEKLAVSNVSFGSLSAESPGSVSLTAQAPTVKDLARQLLNFQQNPKVISEVLMGGIAVGEAATGEPSLVQTTFQLTLAPGWLESTDTSQ